MANKRFRGDAVDIAQVSKITVGGTWANADTVTCTIGVKSFTITFGNGVPTTAQVAAAIKTAWEGEAITAYGETRDTTGTNIEEFSEITASVNGSVVTLTADTAGVPFTETTTKSSAAGTVTDSTPTACTGPAFFTDIDNWDVNSTPVDNDAMIFENSNRDLLFGISQAGIGPTTIDIWMSYEGKAGLPTWNDNGYYEYRTTYLKLGDAAIATTVTVGKGEGNGSGRFKLDMGAGQTSLTVYNTGSPIENGIEAFLFVGTHVSNAVNVRRGSVGIAVLAGETATIATLNVGWITDQDGDAKVRCGSGVTLTTLNMTGGQVTLNAGLTTIVQVGGTLTQYAGNVTTATIRQGTYFYNGVGTITTLHVHDGATLDLTNGQGNCTITTFNVYPGAIVKSPRGRFGSAPTIRLNGCDITEVTLLIDDDFNVVHV